MKERGRPTVEAPVPELHGHPWGSSAECVAQGTCPIEDPPAGPAWMESVLRSHRGSEPAARDRQVAAASITLLSLEAMGPLGLPPAPPSRCEVAHPRAVAGAIREVLCCLGAIEPGGSVAMVIEPPWYVIRMSGGVGVEASQGASLSRFGELQHSPGILANYRSPAQNLSSHSCQRALSYSGWRNGEA